MKKLCSSMTPVYKDEPSWLQQIPFYLVTRMHLCKSGANQEFALIKSFHRQFIYLIIFRLPTLA